LIKKKLLKKFYLLSILFSSVISNAQVAFETITGSFNCYEEAFSTIQTSTGYTVSANYNCNLIPGNFSSSLLFLDENGDSVNQTNNITANGWMKADGNDLIFAGGTKAGLVYDTLVITKTNTAGDSIWSKQYYLGLCNNVIYDIEVTDDGYVFAGFFSSTVCTSAVYDAFVLKLDKDGNELWLKTFGGAGNQQFYVVKDIGNNLLAAFGWREVESDSLGKFFLAKINAATGDTVSTFTLEIPGLYRGYGMDFTADGNFILSGTRYNQIALFKTDADGKILWEKTFGVTCGSSYFKSYQTIDRNYAFLIYESIGTNCSSTLIKTDTSGSEIWRKTFPATIRTLFQPQIGSYVLSGFRLRPGNFVSDVYVARFDTTYSDTSTAVINSKISSGIVKVFPNPAENFLSVRIDNEQLLPAEIILFNTLGEELQKEILNIRNNTFRIEPKSNQLLFYKILKEGKQIKTGKLMIGNSLNDY
jgi:hypothetical protein